ncbi:MAG TPA: transglycosylase SLT domain-containing protein [Burkholderiales bacterium]|nr:transglycosylase SLT domain-containing protein [Burkholderiales bacterium]
MIQTAIAVATVFALWLCVNWAYQVLRKPSELFFPVSNALFKTPTETWREYGPLFRKHSTAVITPDLLAALAQVEGSGNPVARTYWRLSLQRKPFEVYKPASSAVGMYQITDSTFELAKRYCIRDHVVVEQGAWNDPRACWFNSLYARTIPSDAVELTAAYLDRAIDGMLARHRMSKATLEQKQNLAAVIHLCGAGAGESYVRRRFRLLPGQRCGDHAARVYVERVAQMRKIFRTLESKE